MILRQLIIILLTCFNMKKVCLKLLFFVIVFSFPLFSQAQSLSGDQIYKATVTKVIEQKINTLPDGTNVEQQKLELQIYSGDKKGETIVFNGIGNFDVAKKNLYKVDEQVLVDASVDDQGNLTYFVIDYVRTFGIKVLFFFFCLILLLVGGLKGIRSLFSLGISFLVIVNFIIPQILKGSNPFLICLLGALFILIFSIYTTEGINNKSHVAIISILGGLVFTLLSAWFFVFLTKLSGMADEETMYLINVAGKNINFYGLLLAGIIIGTLGVLDDVVISQIAIVEQLLSSSPYDSFKEIFVKAHKIGVSHISSMTNTLFLAYAGASLPLLILFKSGKSAFSNLGDVINNEAIATEIVRTLTGSIGLMISVPIATALAAWWFKKQQIEK